MKTLKFMLAAATAIGLASAYAEPEAGASTSFEGLAVDTAVVSGITDVGGAGDSFFYYAGNAEDNESQIVAFEGSVASRPRGAASLAPTSEKMLQVSTGTDPLIRTFNSFATGGTPSASGFTADVYVDTLVQFTVTPYTDTVTPGDADKLMVYLKETTNEVNDVLEYSTNLVVVGGYYDGNAFSKTEYVAQDVEIHPNTWYRLTVKAVANYGEIAGYSHPAFFVYLDGNENPVAFDKLAVAETQDGYASPFDEVQDSSAIDNKNVVFSLLCDGNAPAALLGVGFAGEGKVDDLMITTLDPFVTALDFTLTWGSALTPVEYTITNTTFSLSGAAGTSATIKVPIDYPAVTFTVANADGVQKTLSATASGETTGIDATSTEFVWNDYLGEAVSGAYQIDDANDLVLLSKGVFSGLATSGETFKQTANIDMTGVTDFYGIGWFNASTSFASVPTGVASDGKTDLPFAGTYDGQGYTISNVTIVRHNYAGVFNNVSGTVKDLTVQDIGFSGTCSEWGCAIVGNAASGSLLENLTAVTSSGFNWGDSANHNVAGIVVRPIGAAIIRGCVNNANISATAKRLGGIAAFVGSGSTGTVFDSCTNNAALVSTDGTRGVGGILGCAEGNTTETATYIRNCVDFGSETAQGSGGHAGAIVGSNWNGSYTYTDDGGNTFKASTVDCGYVKNAVFGRAYATASTISGTDYLTTVKAADLAAGGTYTLLQDVAAGTVFTLQAAGDTIAFDTNGYTFGGTVDSAAAALGVSSATAGTVTTYTAFAAEAQVNSGAKYATLKEAVDAADTGDTVTVLANCSVTNGNVGITFTKGINLVNNYTITIDGANYALRIANGTTTPVTMSGTGSLVWANGSGSPILVGVNEKKASYGINDFCEGSFVLNGGTLTSTYKTAKGGNLVKLEAGTFVLNDGTINGGTRGVKADSEGNDATCVLTINGGTIVNTNSAAIAASTAGSGSSTVTVNAGTFTGKIDGAGMVTIPGTSTAKFDRDQSEFCESGYVTVLSDGWYVVQAAPSGESLEPGEQSSTTYASQADAEAAAANVTIAASDAVTNALDSAAQATYLANFEAKVVSAGEGQYKVEVGLTTAAETALQAEVDADAAEVVEDLSKSTVTLTTTPGFYYSFEYGTTLGNMTEVGTRTLATGTELTLTRPTTGGATSGFYKVLVNVVPATVTP